MNTAYILQRLVLMFIVVLGVSFTVFLIVHLVPGDPARVSLGMQASESAVEALRERMGLNQPFLVQYGNWLLGAVRGDLGESILTGQEVFPQVMGRLPGTLTLAGAALVIGMLIAFPAGIISAIRSGSRLDITVSSFSQMGIATPDFWMSILLVMVFSLGLGWLPPSGYIPLTESVTGWLSHLILPGLTAGLISGSIQTRFVRSAMLDVLHQDYIRTARAKGLREAVILSRHALRNAMISIVTIIGLQVTALMSSVVVVEVVFAWPGLGRLALEAVLDRDYPMLQGAVLVVAIMVSLVNLLVDLAYVLLDPRIEYA